MADGDVGEAELAAARARLALALRVEDDDSWASMQRLGRELLLLGAARETRTRLAASFPSGWRGARRRCASFSSGSVR